jgi:hypothetical protein
MALQLVSTEKVAALFQVKAESVRRALSLQGHYFSLRPVKLPNGRLGWPLDDVERALRDLSAKTSR